MRRIASWVSAFFRQPFRPLAAAGVVALAPKCVLCLAAYAGLGALLGIRSREMCGSAGPGFPWREALAGAGLAVGIVGAVVRRRPKPGQKDTPAGLTGAKPAARFGPPPGRQSQSFKPLRSSIRGVHFSTRDSRVADCLAPEMKRM